jgi:cytochrome c oxidase assembly protein subunit 15
MWLVAVAVLIFAMVVLGGVTRLTRSGLSIVEWNPVMGAIPPLSEQQWLAEFEKYQQTPEYREVNRGMSLAAFKQIYWIEWAHRLLGRLIGLVFIVPLAWFALTRRLPRPVIPKLLGLFVLGGLQGALGWFMVQSGLVDVPRVSPYRLTAHLGLAVLLYGYTLWMALGLLRPSAPPEGTPGLRRFGWVFTALVFLMILVGGFVAGTRAGFVFNTFPLMYDHFVPPGLYALEPWWVNHFENVATVQFTHRLLAYVLLVVVALYWLASRRRLLSLPVRRAFHLLVAALLVQTGLGIATLLLVVPVWLGALHQAGALAVFTVAVYLNRRLAGAT